MIAWRISGPKTFNGSIEVPGDKSISHRAVMIGALAEGSTHITNFLPSDDCQRTLAAFRQLGIEATQHSLTEITVFGGQLSEPNNYLDMGNSGTGVRLLAGVLAGQPFLSVITGDDSIRQRPMKRVCDPLRKMGATILSRSGDLAPMAIRGGVLSGIDYDSPVASAQVKSAVLLAGLFAEGVTSVTEPTMSRDHTERMLRAFGANLTREETRIEIKPGDTLRGREVQIPGDISSAAFFIAGALITPNSELRIKSVGVNPTRTGLLDALIVMGADITLENLTDFSGEPVADLVVKSSQLVGARFGGDIIPRMIDEIPVLALVAAFAEGDTVIEDASELRVKESDRVVTIADCLKAFGANAIAQIDGLIIHGGATLRGSQAVNSRGDHRIAMMGAIAGTAIEGETVIENTDCVSTSFPSFLSTLERSTAQ